MHWINSHPQLVFYILLLIAVLLSRIPMAGKYFRSLNTLIHEAGHAFATLALSSEVIAVNLFADTSGTTVTKAKSKFSQAIISLAGYPFSALVSLLCLYMLASGLNLYILFTLTSITLIIMILSIKNAYGYFWTGTFILLNILLIYFNNKLLVSISATFFTLIIFTDAIISAFILLALSIKQPKKAGDATNMNKLTGLHSAFWAVFLLAITLLISYFSVVHYFPSLRSIF